jgi:hypothetical protein
MDWNFFSLKKMSRLIIFDQTIATDQLSAEKTLETEYEMKERLELNSKFNSYSEIKALVSVDNSDLKTIIKLLAVNGKFIFSNNISTNELLLNGFVNISGNEAYKPNYNVGSKGMLKKKKQVVKVVEKWNDQESELIDDQLLLEDEDLVKPVVEPCSTKKKACKDCTCGRAEQEALVTLDTITVVPKKVTSSCGSCYLGDAYRCGTCPYLGMPAFKPGDKVMLGGNFLNDDLDL